MEDDDDDIDLNVDGDDEDEYGPGQYTEADIIPCGLDEPAEDKERKALRYAYIRSRLVLVILQ